MSHHPNVQSFEKVTTRGKRAGHHVEKGPFVEEERVTLESCVVTEGGVSLYSCNSSGVVDFLRTKACTEASNIS